MSAPIINLSRDIGTSVATRLRGSASVVLDVNKTDSGLPDAGEFVLAIGDEHFPVVPGTNTITFEFPIAPDFGLDTQEYELQLSVIALDTENVASAWAEITLSQCDVLASDSGSVATAALTMTPIAVNGPAPGGSGGFHIEKTGALASVGTVEIVGYYAAPDASALLAASSLYAPRWIDEDQYVPVSPAVAIPVFGSGSAYEGDWGWFSGDPLESTIPNGQVSIVKVSLDGAPPVLAVLSNEPGF